MCKNKYTYCQDCKEVTVKRCYKGMLVWDRDNILSKMKSKELYDWEKEEANRCILVNERCCK